MCLGFVTKDGNVPKSKLFKSIDELDKYFKNEIPKNGRIHIGWDYDKDINPKNGEHLEGHIITGIIKDGNITFYDPQDNTLLSKEYIYNRAFFGDKVEVLRVDNLLINKSILHRVAKSYK